MLRDMLPDTAEGFINIPREYLEEHNISPQDIDGLPYRVWVQERVKLTRRYFEEGKRYLETLDVMRCKLAGYWYCARYEGLLNAIENENYLLRTDYCERRKLSSWLRMMRIGIRITLTHYFDYINRKLRISHNRSQKRSNINESTGQ